jgi:glucose-1-phosphate adenylyltransferase
LKHKVITFVLAGGRGHRLFSLTKERAKPAVPFGGKYRIIDFVLSNLINSGLFSIYVLVQFKSQSLLRHLRDGWQFGGLLNDQFIIPVPAQMRSADEAWYRGTADAIYQNLNLLDNLDEHLIAIFGGDHVYRMDVRDMVEFHETAKADVTVAAIPVSAHLASDFGVIEAGPDGAVLAFHEKKAAAPTIPGQPHRVYASMGNYLFSARTLLQELETDAQRKDSTHDFGHDILPSLLGRAALYAYDFQANRIPGESAEAPVYWRDVGTLEAYYEAHMDLCGLVPSLNLYNRSWPIRTASYPDPSAKFTFDEAGQPGQAIGSVISGGCILAGGVVRHSVLARGVHVHSGALVEEAIVLDNCVIGRRSRIRRAILDENVTVAEEECIGYDLERDRARYHVSESGIVVVSRGSTVDRGAQSPLGVTASAENPGDTGSTGRSEAFHKNV